MSKLASGPQWKPHLKIIDGHWVVKWSAPFVWPPDKGFDGRTPTGPGNYLEVFGASVHFMTQSTPRGHKARDWFRRMNGPWNCRSTLPEQWAHIVVPKVAK